MVVSWPHACSIEQRSPASLPLAPWFGFPNYCPVSTIYLRPGTPCYDITGATHSRSVPRVPESARPPRSGLFCPSRVLQSTTSILSTNRTRLMQGGFQCEAVLAIRCHLGSQCSHDTRVLASNSDATQMSRCGVFHSGVGYIPAGRSEDPVSFGLARTNEMRAGTRACCTSNFASRRWSSSLEGVDASCHVARDARRNNDTTCSKRY